MQTGTIFQSSKDFGKAFTAPLNNLIAGWQTGIVSMKVGGIRRLSIPAVKADGEDAGTGALSGDLVFDIELLAFS
jgi:FKBP-type peptidyl-prolyl cis-trans isomerase